MVLIWELKKKKRWQKQRKRLNRPQKFCRRYLKTNFICWADGRLHLTALKRWQPKRRSILPLNSMMLSAIQKTGKRYTDKVQSVLRAFAIIWALPIRRLMSMAKRKNMNTPLPVLSRFARFTELTVATSAKTTRPTGFCKTVLTDGRPKARPRLSAMNRRRSGSRSFYLKRKAQKQPKNRNKL